LLDAVRVQRAMRIGAENSTCAYFRKRFFVFWCCENAFFFRVSGSTVLASLERTNGPRARARRTLCRQCCDSRCEVRAKRAFRRRNALSELERRRQDLPGFSAHFSATG
jgi:hypothetical protein